jgi:hypothetical protein
MRTTLTIAALTALIALTPVAAQAGTECQSAPTVGGGSSAAVAWQNWQDNVANAYGSAWAKLDLAQNRSVAPITLPGLFGPDVTTYTAVGTPCRTVRVTAGLTNNVGNFEVMQSDDAGPKAFGAVKKHKLAVSFN